MPKMETTAKWLKNNYARYWCGYCELYYLLRDPQYYTAGVYGWNFDATIVQDGNDWAVIETGYRNMGGVGIPGNITNKYNKIGKKSAGAWARKFKHNKQDIYDYLRKRVIRETKKYYKEGKNE